jgi:hypothetical protein
MQKKRPVIVEFKLANRPLAPDSMTLSEIIARLKEIDDIADIPLALGVSFELAAEYLQLENELDRLTDTTRKHPRD